MPVLHPRGTSLMGLGPLLCGGAPEIVPSPMAAAQSHMWTPPCKSLTLAKRSPWLLLALKKVIDSSGAPPFLTPMWIICGWSHLAVLLMELCWGVGQCQCSAYLLGSGTSLPRPIWVHCQTGNMWCRFTRITFILKFSILCFSLVGCRGWSLSQKWGVLW